MSIKGKCAIVGLGVTAMGKVYSLWPATLLSSPIVSSPALFQFLIALYAIVCCSICLPRRQGPVTHKL